MTPTAWQGRYTPPAAPVTFALRSAHIIADASEPSRFSLHAPGSVPVRAASTRTISTRSVRTALSGDGRRGLWIRLVGVGMNLFCPTALPRRHPGLRPCARPGPSCCVALRFLWVPAQGRDDDRVDGAKTNCDGRSWTLRRAFARLG